MKLISSSSFVFDGSCEVYLGINRFIFYVFLVDEVVKLSEGKGVLIIFIFKIKGLGVLDKYSYKVKGRWFL